MKDFRGQIKRARASALFTDQEVRAIRRADEVGSVTRLQQARTYGVGKETIARLCRGETYYWVAQDDELVVERPEGYDPMTQEPTDADIKASQEKMLALLKEQNLGDMIVKEMENDSER